MEILEWLVELWANNWVLETLLIGLFLSSEHTWAKIIVSILTFCLVYCVFFKETKLAKIIIKVAVVTAKTIRYSSVILIIICFIVGVIRLLL